MINLNVEEKIEKSIKFIKKKFDKAVIEVKVINKENLNLYIELMGDGYEIHEKFNGRCNGILIIQDGENNFYEFKSILKDIPNHFDGNGLVFIRYDISIYDEPEYIKNQFMTYFKLNKYRNVEDYTLLSNDGDLRGIFITAQYHLELLDNNTEYEEYTPNFFINKSRCGCGGCCKGKCSKNNCQKAYKNSSL